MYSSGTSIASFPSDGIVIKQKLNHQGNEVVTGETKIEEDVAVLGLYQVPGPTSGRIVLYGDSNCLDNAHMEKGTDFCADVCLPDFLFLLFFWLGCNVVLCSLQRSVWLITNFL